MFQRLELPLGTDSNTSPDSLNEKNNRKIKAITPVSVEFEVTEQPKKEIKPSANSFLERLRAAQKLDQERESSKVSPGDLQKEESENTATPNTANAQSGGFPVRRNSKIIEALGKTQATVSKWKIAKKARIIGVMNLQKKEILNKNYGIDESTAEKQENQEEIRCILPTNTYIMHWHRIMKAFTLYLVFIYIFRVCLLPLSIDFLFYLEIAMQSCFFIDVVLNFFLAYHERDDLVTDLRSIVFHYLFTFFIFDLVAAIPSNIIALCLDYEPGDESHRILRLLTALRVGKFLINIATYEGWKDIAFFSKRSPTIIRLIKILVLLIYFVHLSACIFVLLAKIDGTNNTWIFLNNNQDLSPFELYTNAMYWATQTIVTVGFGDVNIITNAERLMALILMYIGSAVYSFMISNLGAVVEESDSIETTLKAKINSFKTLAKETNLPEELVQKVKKFIESNHKHNPRVSMHDQSFINELPFTLKAQLMFNINAKVVESVPFLKDKDVDFILKMAPNLKPIELLPKEILFRENEYPEDVFFLTSGSIYLKGKTGTAFYEVSEGEMFGDIEVLQNIARITTAQAQSRCSLFSIEKESFTEILNSYPDVKEALILDGKNKKKRLVDLKKKNKFDLTTGAQIFVGNNQRSHIINAADYANRMYEKPTDKFEREISAFLERGVGKKWKTKYLRRLKKKPSKENNQTSIVNDSLNVQKDLDFGEEFDGLTNHHEEVISDVGENQFNAMNMSGNDGSEGDPAQDAELILKKKKEFEEKYFGQAKKLGDELLTTIDTLEDCNDNMKKQDQKYEKLLTLIQAIEKKQNEISQRVEVYKKKLSLSGKATIESESLL